MLSKICRPEAVTAWHTALLESGGTNTRNTRRRRGPCGGDASGRSHAGTFPFVAFVAVVAAPPVLRVQRRGVPGAASLVTVLLVGNSANDGLSALVVLLSLVFFARVLAPVGMLLPALLTMAVEIALESCDESRWLAVLPGAQQRGFSPGERTMLQSRGQPLLAVPVRRSPDPLP